MRTKLMLVAVVAALVLAGACGDDDDSGGGDDADATTTSVADGGGSTTTGGGGGGGGGEGEGGGNGGGGGGNGGGGGGGTVTPDVEAVAEALNGADLGCDAIEDLLGIDGVDGAGQCEVNGAPAYVYTFADNEARDAFAQPGGVIDCTFIAGAGLEFRFVVADRIVVRPENVEDADAIADALDGEAQDLTCDAPAG